MNAVEINKELAAKVLQVVDAGLCNGVGTPEPGNMCVEAAVCYAMGLPHGDQPTCVSPALRQLKISLNDKNWSSRAARAKGLRRLAIAQLGSKGVLDDKEFVKRVAELAIRKCVPNALRAAASIQKNQEHREKLIAAAFKCEAEGSRSSALEAKKVANGIHAAAADAADAAAAAAAAYAADAAAYAADAAAYAADAYAARDTSLAAFAEDVVQILIDMKAPGCEWLDLTEAA